MRGTELERLHDERARVLYAFLLNLTRDLLQDIFVRLASVTHLARTGLNPLCRTPRSERAEWMAA